MSGSTTVEIAGVAVLSFDARAALILAWARTAGCNAGTWTPQDCAAGAWAPVDGCGTGSWTITRLPELEPTA
jgi:hypothetical protein